MLDNAEEMLNQTMGGALWAWSRAEWQSSRANLPAHGCISLKV